MIALGIVIAMIGVNDAATVRVRAAERDMHDRAIRLVRVIRLVGRQVQVRQHLDAE
ncbi:MAG TPA: hypothetical protein VIU61_07710 [Kofleriaceae bacterium]